MVKDIERILNDVVVPEMEYEPKYDIGKTKSKKKKSATASVVTVDQVPEVVLPKTKAEVYLEAKGRLTEKTSAVSRTTDGTAVRTRTRKTSEERRKPKKPEPSTVELETAAVANTVSHRTVERKHIRPVSDVAWVGRADELVPFAWRMPLIADLARPSKVYKQVIRDSQTPMLPAPREK